MQHIELEIRSRSGVKLLCENIELCNNLEEIQAELNKLLLLSYRYATAQNNRPNKALKIFTEYLNIEDTREEKIIKQIRRNQANKQSYKNYLDEFTLLRKRGYSYRKIAKHAKDKLGITISSETLRNALKGVSNV
jgi:hypothetical protein